MNILKFGLAILIFLSNSYLNATSIKSYTVIMNNVFLREEPNLTSKIVTVELIGSEVILEKIYLEENDNTKKMEWYYVKSGTSIGKKGWVLSSNLLNWGVPIGSKGFEKVIKIKILENELHSIPSGNGIFDENKFNGLDYEHKYKIRNNGSYSVIIYRDNLKTEISEIGYLYKKGDLYFGKSPNSSFMFYIDNNLDAIIVDDGGYIFAKRKIKLLEIPLTILVQ